MCGAVEVRGTAPGGPRPALHRALALLAPGCWRCKCNQSRCISTSSHVCLVSTEGPVGRPCSAVCAMLSKTNTIIAMQICIPRSFSCTSKRLLRRSRARGRWPDRPRGHASAVSLARERLHHQAKPPHQRLGSGRVHAIMFDSVHVFTGSAHIWFARSSGLL